MHPVEVMKPGRNRRKSENTPRGKLQNRGAIEGKLRIRPVEVMKSGRNRRKNKNTPRGNHEPGAQ